MSLIVICSKALRGETKMENETQTYKGFTIRKTETTCDIVKLAFGNAYDTTANVYEIEGLKSAGTLPFITSIREAKEFINKSLSPEVSEFEHLTDEEVHSEISY